MNRLLALILLLLSVLCVTQSDATFHGVVSYPTVSFPSPVLWFYGSGINNTLSTFLASGKQTGIYIINDAGDSAAIMAKGYVVEGGLPAEAAGCAQNDTPNCGGISNGLSYIEGVIDGLASQGATYLIVNEPCVTDGDYTTGLSDPCSIPYNAIGMDAIKSYIISKGYNMKVGYTLANSDAATTTYKQLFDWTSSNGYHLMDMAEDEVYYTTCCNAGYSDPWGTFHAAYPTVIRSSLIYSLGTFCAFDYISYGGTIDMISFWNVDNYGQWSGPSIDPNEIAAAESLASTGSKTTTCNHNFSTVTNGSNDPYFTTFSLSVADGSYANWTSPYTITSCDYQVYSGVNGVNGLGASGVVQTYPTTAGTWASRTCNSTINITVGASANCRDEVSDAITASISGTTVNITAGTFTQPIQVGTALFASGVSAGTFVSATIPNTGGTGGTGTYTVNNSQSVSSRSMSARLGLYSCLVVVRAHDNSPSGLGDINYNESKIAF